MSGDIIDLQAPPDLEEYAHGLRAALDQVREDESRLQELLAHTKDRRKRLELAINHLVGERTPPPRAIKVDTKQRTRYVSEDTINRLAAALQEHCELDEDITAESAAHLIDISKESARHALRELREREVIRLTKAGGRGVGKTTWRLMPNGS